MAERNDQADVVFLLGAGASKAAGVPDTYEFVDVFRKSLDAGHPDTRLLDVVLARLREWRKAPVDIELLLDALTRVAEREQDPGVVFCRDPLPLETGLVAAAGRLAGALRDCIKQKTYVEPEQTGHLDPLMAFIRHYGCIDVATLNYDTVIEEFGFRQRIAVHDGFQSGWNLESLRNASTGIRLYKLHGSVTWYETDDGRHVKDAARVESSQVKLVQAGSADNLMLYPVRKWAYSEPMVGLLFEFKRLIESPGTRFLVVVGYSFRDDHVQGVIRDAARNNTQLEIVLVDPAAHTIRRKLFDDLYGPCWPTHLRRRTLCLPYRFESFLPYLKHGYLRNLRTGVEREAISEMAEATGESPLHWTQAAKAFGECEHAQRLDEIIRRGRPFEADRYAELPARLLTTVNAAIGGTDEDSDAAARDAKSLLQELVIENVTWVFIARPPRIELRHTMDMSSTGNLQLANELDAILERARRSSACALRTRPGMERIERLIAGLGKLLRDLPQEPGTVMTWMTSVGRSPDERGAIHRAIAAHDALPGSVDDSHQREAIGALLTRVVRATMMAMMHDVVDPPRPCA